MGRVLLVGLGLLGALAGFVVTRVDPAVKIESTTATLGGVTLIVDAAGWVRLDHDPTTMPMSMMPGAPADGSGRVAVSVTMANPATTSALVDTAELTLVAKDGRSWVPGASTLDDIILGAGQRLGVTMWFDVDLPAEDLHLAWQRAGGAVWFPVLGTDSDSEVHH